MEDNFKVVSPGRFPELNFEDLLDHHNTRIHF